MSSFTSSTQDVLASGQRAFNSYAVTLSDGRAVVAYLTGPNSNPVWFGQVINADGTMAGQPITLGAVEANNTSQTIVGIQASANGSFVTQWMDEGPAVPTYYYKTFSSNGAVLDAFTSIPTNLTNSNIIAFAALADGTVVTDSASYANSTYDITATQMTAVGASVGTSDVTGTLAGYGVTEMTSTALAGGGYVVAWDSTNVATEATINDAWQAQVYADGTMVGGEVTLEADLADGTNGAASSTSVNNVTLVSLPGGGFGMVFLGGAGITVGNFYYYQGFDAAGAASGPRIRLMSADENLPPKVVGLSDGNILVVHAALSAPAPNSQVPGPAQTLGDVYSLAGTLVSSSVLVNGPLYGFAVTAMAGDKFLLTGTNIAAGQSVAQVFSINATQAIAPVLAAQTANQSLLQGHPISFSLPEGTFTDPQGQALTYTAKLSNGQPLPTWLSFNSATQSFSGTAPTTIQTLAIQVTATDSSGLSTSETFNAIIPASAPVLAHQTAAQTLTQGHAVSFSLPTGTFTDPQGQTLTYTAKLSNGQPLPTWLHFNAATGAFTGTVPAGMQTLALMVTATNSSGLSRAEVFNAIIPAAAPVLAHQTGMQAWNQGHALSFSLPTGTFTDPQGQGLTYTATLAHGQTLPAWLHFNAATQTFTGTPPSGVFTFGLQVAATDTSGLSNSETFVAVAPPIAPVLAHQTASQTLAQGHAVSFSLPTGTFTDPQGQALTYTAKLANGAALPSWLHFNATTQTFSGTAPAAPQTLALQVTATDTSGLATSETFSAVIPALAPVLAHQTATQTLAQGHAVNFSLPAGSFTDPQGEALTYTATLSTGGVLPAWLHFNAATQTFSGTAPTGAQTLALMVTAKDTSGLSQSEIFTAVIPALAPVLAHQTATQTLAQGHAVSFSLPAGTFTDPQGQALSYTATLASGGALPPWLHFSAATQTFSGTAPSAAQTLALQVTARDTSGLSRSETFNAVIPVVAPAVGTALPHPVSAAAAVVQTGTASPAGVGAPNLSPAPQNQIIGVTPASLNITPATPGAFITGSSGNDTFSLNAGSAALPASLTIGNFHFGDSATVWGVNATDFTLTRLDNAGAAGATGVDLLFTASGHAVASLVLAGYSSADLSNGRLSLSYGRTQDLPGLPGSQYLAVHAN